LGRCARVAVEEHVVADEDLAFATWRRRLELLVEDGDTGAGRAAARGGRGGSEVGGVGDARPRNLGRAVEVVEDVAEVVHERRDERAGHRRAAARDDPQRRQVVAGANPFWQVENPLEHDRHGEQRVAVLLGDRAQGFFRVELADQAERRPQRHPDLHRGQAPAVEQRCRDDDAIVGAQRDPGQHRGRGAQPLRRRAARALRRAGGAGGEHDDASRPLDRLRRSVRASWISSSTVG